MRRSLKFAIAGLAAPLMALSLLASPASATNGSAVAAVATGSAALDDGAYPCITEAPLPSLPDSGCTPSNETATGTFTGLVLGGVFVPPSDSDEDPCAGTLTTDVPVPYATNQTVAVGHGTIGDDENPTELDGDVGTCGEGFATLTTGSFVRAGTVAIVGFNLDLGGSGETVVLGALAAVPGACPDAEGEPGCSQVAGPVHSVA